MGMICLSSATRHMIFTPTQGCICFAWQNENYWELPREICQRILRGSWVLHFFPVTLVKRNFVWRLDMGYSCKPFECALVNWSCTNYTVEDSRISVNLLERTVFKSPNCSVLWEYRLLFPHIGGKWRSFVLVLFIYFFQNAKYPI